MHDPEFSVQFLLSHNLPGSVTRLTADAATALAQRGIATTVLFPAVDWWDYQVFSLVRMPWPGRCKHVAWLVWQVLMGALFRRPWCGFKHHAVHPAVRTKRFLLTPSARAWRDDSITVVHPPYLMPHLLRTLPRPTIAMVGAVHINLEEAMHSDVPEVAAWYRHRVASERLLSMPCYAVGEEARQAAERLGISVRTVIYNGVDLRLVHPAGPARPEGPLVITLYCDTNAQKGTDVGIAALQAIKTEAPDVRLCSVGHLADKWSHLFDRNYGYLHGETYAEALRSSDIFIYPSRYDGFGVPAMEAMASGAALVTTAVGGVKEYAVHGENALVCEPGNAAALREQVLRLVRDRALRDRLRTNGLQTASSFSVEHNAEQLLAFLREVYEETHNGASTMVNA